MQKNILEIDFKYLENQFQVLKLQCFRKFYKYDNRGRQNSKKIYLFFVLVIIFLKGHTISDDIVLIVLFIQKIVCKMSISTNSIFEGIMGEKFN